MFKIKFYLLQIIIFLLFCCNSNLVSEDKTQFNIWENNTTKKFQYANKITGKVDTLNKITLTEEILSKSKSDLSDLRIYGFTNNKSEVIIKEVPFVINKRNKKNKVELIKYKIINESKSNGFYFFTFEINESIELNEINLIFENQNFDWLVNLEASNDIINWYNKLNNYRILSINNNFTNYSFTKLKFNNSKYKYYRINLKTETKPILKECQIIKIVEDIGKFINYEPVYKQIKELKKKNSTEIIIKLPYKVPINKIILNINNEFDYFRKVSINSVIDSFKTETGYHYSKFNLINSQVSSLEDNSFEIESYYTDNIIIEIFNQNNQKLNIKNIEVLGNNIDLVFKLQDNYEYYLFYGNKSVDLPNYDLKYFLKDFSQEVNELYLDNEIKNDNNKDKTTISPLIIDKKWLWLSIISIIVIISCFTYKMIKTK